MTIAGVLPVADHWYQAAPVSQAITLIREPHVHPLLRSNIWHVRGSLRDLVIDCGLGITPLRPAFPRLFSRDPILVLTHAHLDHMGSAREFEHCLAHRREPAEHPPRGSLYGGPLAAELGLDEQLPPLLLSAIPHHGYDPAGYRLHPAAVSRWVDEGDSIDLGDRVFTVLHLPGHSPGSIALLDQREGTLFSGDTVYDDDLLDELTGSCRADYLTTMRRLRDLPVRIVHAGHDASFDRARLHQLIDTYITTRTTTTGHPPAPASHKCTRRPAPGSPAANPGT
jgi:glyoxylase-like metal-dependent hydrolase (beta-lactamase superfamily II)